MKERPILFSGPMVRALLAGTKTQTRRLVKLPKNRDSFVLLDNGKGWWPYQSDDGESELCNDGNEHPYSSPYGQPGDSLWVREDFRFPQSLDDLSPVEVGEKCLAAGYSKPWCPTEFKADGCQTGNWIGFETPPNTATPGRRRASMHMPRWASRILLEIVSVRVERLNDISEADAIAEGIQRGIDGMWNGAPHKIKGTPRAFHTPIGAYDDLWEHLNGAGSWAANPWVWVVEFKRVEGGAA